MLMGKEGWLKTPMCNREVMPSSKSKKDFVKVFQAQVVVV